MKRIVSLLLVILISQIQVNSSSAQIPIKTGLKCKQLGAIQTYRSINYICKKYGNKLAWSVDKNFQKIPMTTKQEIKKIGLLRIDNFQKQNLSVKYVGNKPFASTIFRWPGAPTTNPLIKNISTNSLIAYVVFYQGSKKSTPPPCDLSKALCEPIKSTLGDLQRVILVNINEPVVTLNDLEINTSYGLGIYAIYGTSSNLESDVDSYIKEFSTTNPRGFVLLDSFYTSGEVVPKAPIASIVGGTGIIQVSLPVFPDIALRVDVRIAGGIFGGGKVVETFTAAGTKTIIAPGAPSPGLVYTVSVLIVTPTEINSDPLTQVVYVIK